MPKPQFKPRQIALDGNNEYPKTKINISEINRTASLDTYLKTGRKFTYENEPTITN